MRLLSSKRAQKQRLLSKQSKRVFRWRSDSGAAIIEFITFGVATLMPLSLLLTGVFTLQRTSFTAQAAVREATRAFVLAPSESEAFLAAQSAADQVFNDAHLDPKPVQISCSQSPCLQPAGSVRIAIKFPLSLMVKTWMISAAHEEPITPWM